MNIAVVRGQVVRGPVARETAIGVVLSFDVAVSYDEGPSESVEVVWIDPPDESRWPRQGVEVFVAGRVRRRFFKTNTGQVAGKTELVADTVLTARQGRMIERRLERIVEAVSA
jgi:hypothetical protein